MALDLVTRFFLHRRGVDRTEVVCQILAPPGGADRFEPAAEFWDATNRQDWRVCESAQRGIGSRGYRPGPYSHAECTVAAFDRHYLAAMGGAAANRAD